LFDRSRALTRLRQTQYWLAVDLARIAEQYPTLPARFGGPGPNSLIPTSGIVLRDTQRKAAFQCVIAFEPALLRRLNVRNEFVCQFDAHNGLSFLLRRVPLTPAGPKKVRHSRTNALVFAGVFGNVRHA
jgi:hypothetical protein